MYPTETMGATEGLRLIKDNIEAVRQRISAAAARVGRTDAITLVAVTKNHPVEFMKEAVAVTKNHPF